MPPAQPRALARSHSDTLGRQILMYCLFFLLISIPHIFYNEHTFISHWGTKANLIENNKKMKLMSGHEGPDHNWGEGASSTPSCSPSPSLVAGCLRRIGAFAEAWVPGGPATLFLWAGPSGQSDPVLPKSGKGIHSWGSSSSPGPPGWGRGTRG